MRHPQEVIMQTIERMISTSRGQSPLTTGAVDCIAACVECAAACVACADACLLEQNVAALRRCIRLNQDCADLCAATARVLSRLSDGDIRALRHQLEACALICATCGAECRQHAQHHEHCKVCADVCRRCEEQCRKAVRTLEAT
jgi:hypothetical protein